jgi:predicted GNAT family N-acyltransferase
MNIKSPKSQDEWTKYFELRWQVLRAPWDQPIGSEKDNIEFLNSTYHAMALNENNDVLGVARIHLLDNNWAQIRYMAVSENSQGLGIGNSLIAYLENIAQLHKVNKIILQARENAVPFYQKNEYTLKEKTFLMYNQIQHYLMEKEI